MPVQIDTGLSNCEPGGGHYRTLERLVFAPINFGDLSGQTGLLSGQFVSGFYQKLVPGTRCPVLVDCFQIAYLVSERLFVNGFGALIDEQLVGGACRGVFCLGGGKESGSEFSAAGGIPQYCHPAPGRRYPASA